MPLGGAAYYVTSLFYEVHGHMQRWIHSFLSDRTFQVQLGTTMSDMFIQENGVPQGEVLCDFARYEDKLFF